MDLDEILPSVGEFGKYQKLVLWFILFPAVFPCGFHAYNQLFMATVPEHWCKLPKVRGVDPEKIKNFSIPMELTMDNKVKFSECAMYDLDYDTINLDRSDRSHFIRGDATVPCKNGWTYRVDDVRNSVISEWDLVCSKDFSPTLALVLFGCSGLIGNYIFGYIQDGLGRKPAYFIYLLIQCVFGVATALANNFIVWVLFRVGVGFTIPAILGTPYVLAIELVGPKDRTTVTILINIAYSLSLISLAIVVWAVRNWRWMALATTAPFITLFATWCLLPESPRWLLAQGKYEEAEKILEIMARINGKTFPGNSLPKSLKNAHSETKYGIMHLFKNRNLRWKTIIVTFLWFTNTSVYVGLSYYAPALGGDEFLNFFLAGAVELPTYLFLWPAMERLGRRWTLCISMIIGGSSCLATFLVQNDYMITLTLYCIGKMGISSSFVVLPLMASELYPTVVRGLGMSLSSVVGMLGPIFIPLVNYLGSDMIILPLIIMGAMLVAGGLCSLLLPETLNEHLPQTLEDAERTKLDFFACCVPPQRDESVRRNNADLECNILK
ncbi:beta-alanine transporter [Anthonomus grandis grandis]|uniref:beta-alanine transporter n=1 Tax=Anthonomus grandis grandis TaxID=2921223 RepID=UPI002166987D|nr:beta-alanine transporter [Anthonomus grandis grandis]